MKPQGILLAANCNSVPLVASLPRGGFSAFP